MFRFENVWLQHEGCRDVIHKAWNDLSHPNAWENLNRKIKNCSAALGQWDCDVFGNIRKDIKITEEDIRNCNLGSVRMALLKKLGDLRKKEEILWAQRARADFLKHGDSNSRWFHARASIRRSNNMIHKIEKPDGSFATEHEDIAQTVSAFFEGLFNSQGVDGVDNVLNCIEGRVSQRMNDMLLAPYSINEIFEALQSMHPCKAPGPDGLNPMFFQKFWDIVGDDVSRAVLHILQGNDVPNSLNHTHIVLIPKLPNPTRLSDFRPISLCNVVYKIASKVISNRLKSCLPLLISETQSAFTPGRLISDNIMMAYEIFHSMKNNPSRSGSMAIKVDMSKAYDRVEWEFLQKIMLKFGFDRRWVNVIMSMVESTTFSFVINGAPSGFVRPSRGLRQGDPLSPYLFLFVTEGLIGLLKKAEISGYLTGHKTCFSSPIVSHLLFADDSIFFCKANVEQARVVKDILTDYARASGQEINFDKSNVVFQNGVSENRRREVLNVLDIREILAQNKYLGLPTYIGRSKNRAFMFLRDKVAKRLSSWADKFISIAGREVLIKAVAQAIPTYAMSVFKLPRDFCSSLYSLILRYWWGQDMESRKIHWVSKDRLAECKKNGGLGFRDFSAFNDALLAKQVWRLKKDNTSLVARLLKARYFPNSDILEANLGCRPSFIWRSLQGAISLVKGGYRWLIGNGESVRVFEDRWLPRPYTFKPIVNLMPSCDYLRVADLIDKERGSWKESLVREVLSPIDAELVLDIPLCDLWPSDRIIWHFSNSGDFTVKSAYFLARWMANGDLPCPSSDSIRVVWKRLWNLNIPPRMKLFVWKVGTNALATKCNLARRIPNFQPVCELCGNGFESDAHAIFECEWAKSIWQASGFDEKLWKSGVFRAFDRFCFCVDSLDDDSLGNFIAVAWECWNQRNKSLFQSRDKSSSNVVSRALSFVQSFREARDREDCEVVGCPTVWKPPIHGVLKINFDAGKLADLGGGWGVVARDSNGDICWAANQHHSRWAGAVIEEAKACLLAIRKCLELGVTRACFEGDSLNLINYLKKKTCPDSTLGLIVSQILDLASNFDFVLWCHIKRCGNNVAHTLAHLQPFSLEGRFWLDNVPDTVSNLATKDMFNFVNVGFN